MRIHLSTPLSAPPEWVATQLQSTAVFRHIAAPFLKFRPAPGAQWPPRWKPGDELTLRMRLLGALPMGSQTVRISMEPAAEPGGWPTLRDNGEGMLMRRWDHRITLQPLPDGGTLYTDQVDVGARHLPWLMTPVSALFAQVFYRHRQRRWRQLAAQHAVEGQAPTAPHRRAAFDHLLAGFAGQGDLPAALRWRWLEAAHVLGQTCLPLHWRSHTAMLRYALVLGDVREAAGQLWRLALTPLGHMLARLPLGNIGRSHVSAFRPMVPSAEVTVLMEQALEETALPQVQPSDRAFATVHPPA
jgi:hypothetical protein